MEKQNNVPGEMLPSRDRGGFTTSKKSFAYQQIPYKTAIREEEEVSEIDREHTT